MPNETDWYAYGLKQKKLAKEAVKEIFGIDKTMTDEEVFEAVEKVFEQEVDK